MKAFRILVAFFSLGVVSVSASADPRPVKAAVLRSQGTQFLGMTIWPELNAGWSQFGDVPVQIDYTSLAGYDWTVADITATGADVLIFSCPGFLHHTDAEIAAIVDYVQAGHGLIITYDDFMYNRRALAPLVGLSASNVLGTATSSVPLEVQPTNPGQPLFARLNQPYVSGARTLAGPWYWWRDPWLLDAGTVLATIPALDLPPGPQLAIVAKEAERYRGLYFSYYIEDKAGGANQQDMQVFYNGLVWTGTPEPSAFLLGLAGTTLLVRHRRGRWCV
jgi:hypothetical protein